MSSIRKCARFSLQKSADLCLGAQTVQVYNQDSFSIGVLAVQLFQWCWLCEVHYGWFYGEYWRLSSLCCSSSVLFVLPSDYTCPYHSLFFFADDILPYFVYSVIIIKMLLKHQITGLVLQMLLRNKLLWFVLFGRLTITHFTYHIY